jgi:hypothetical protein
MVQLKHAGKISSQQRTTSVSSAIIVDNKLPKEEPVGFAILPKSVHTFLPVFDPKRIAYFLYCENWSSIDGG